jgi:hypothetical protein
MRRFGLVVCLAAMAACSGKSPAAPSPVNQQVTLSPGQTTTVDGASLSVRFEGVSGDSRCPIDAICITGGDAQVHIVVAPVAGGRQNYTLHTGDMRPVTHGDLTVALVDLTPYPYSARPIQPSEYRATLRLTRE